MKNRLLISALLMNCFTAFAQELCTTDKHQEILFANDSIAKKAYLESDRILLEKRLEKQRLLQMQKA